MKKLLFITTTNLSTNPRLLKELKLANENGYDCTFIGFQLGNWSDKTEGEHINTLKGVKAVYLSAGTSLTLSDQQISETEQCSLNEEEMSGNPGISTPLNVRDRRWLSVVEARYLTTLISKLSKTLNRLFPKNLKINAFAHNKRTWQIVQKLKKIGSKYDLIIAHNLGALYPAYFFSKKHNTPFAFDIEDYHPGEKCSPAEKKRREFLMQKLLTLRPQLPNRRLSEAETPFGLAYISYASPLIGQHSSKLLTKKSEPKLKTVYIRSGTRCISVDRYKEMVEYNSYELPENFLINNSFSEKEFTFKENNSEKTQLVWFSQNIAEGRGLELIIPALVKYKEKVHLTLVGNLYKDFEASFLKNYTDFITIQEPLSQKELNTFLCQFDVGLAIELSTADFNRDICLTNKIFAYTQAGLFVLATDTLAQKQFVEENNLAFQRSGFDSLRLRSVNTSQPPEQAVTERSRSLSETNPSLSEVDRSLSGVDRSLSGVEMTGLLTTQTTKEMEKAIEKILNNINSIRANKKKRFEYAKQLAWEKEAEKLLYIWKSILH